MTGYGAQGSPQCFPLPYTLSPAYYSLSDFGTRRLLGKQPQQFLLERSEGNFPHGFAGIDQQIPAPRKIRPIQPKHLAHSPPQPVAPHSSPQTHGCSDSQA